jgi:threonylcarbamoyladenosine tRNA methylthiotransferase MtaB
MTPTYRILTLGCKLNQSESGALEGRLLALGMRRAAGDPCGPGLHAGEAESVPATGADVVILNTCTVTHNADREARQIARRLRRANPHALLIVTGCYAERDAAAVAALSEIDHVVGLNDELARIPALAAAATGLPFDAAAPPLGRFGTTGGCDPLPDPGDRTRTYLKIQDGCDLRCAYCIIPSVRGGSRSVPPEMVLTALRRLIALGSREIVFTGVNTGDYGRDLVPPTSLAALLRSAAALPGEYRLRLNSLEPKTVTPDIVRCLVESGGRIAPHLQIPLQSGSDRVLARMRRPYRTRDYIRVVEDLRGALPPIGLGADLIVGFPGETDQDARATVDLVASSPLNYLHVFSYSPRPGTPADQWPGQVPHAVLKERSARLRELGARLSLGFRRSFLGRTLPVLALRAVRADGRLRALSDNFIDLGLDCGDRPVAPLMNTFLPARLIAAGDDETVAVPA